MMPRQLMTPAEATVLLAPATSTATRCIQAGLLSLLGAERISFEKPSSALEQSALLLNSPTRPGTSPLPRHLAVLEQALLDYGKGHRLVSSEVLRALQKRFGYGFRRYLQDEVVPGLIERNLLVQRDGKRFGLFRRVTYERTSRGEALAVPLQRLMLAIDKLPSLLTTDPEQAIRLARTAGVLLLMSPNARRQIPMLRKLLDGRAADLPALAILPYGNERERDGELVLEIGDLALALDFESLFDALEAVADFTSGVDSSSSDGGDGGGGGD